MKISSLTILLFLLLIGQRGQGEIVSRTIHFSLSELTMDSIIGNDGEVYLRVSYPETGNEENFGFPELPIKYVTIPLPYEADDISLYVKCPSISSHVLNQRLFPIQKPEVTSIEKEQKEFVPCAVDVYNSNSPYPSSPAKITEISCAGRGKRHVVVGVFPIIYHPTEGLYDFCENVEIILSYQCSRQRTMSLLRSQQHVDVGIPFYEYCVITSQNLKNAFNRLIAWKREKGLNAGIVCKEDLLNNTHIVGDTVSSIYDDAGKIRQYLQYAYASGITKYVLFGGNNQILPIRYGKGSNDTIPSDLYFSELNSNWNTDGDQYYGEVNDNLDYGSELYVGRILCTNTEEIQNYTDKLLRYELNPGNGDFSYLKKALYTQEDQMQRDHEQDSVAAHLHCIFPIDTIFSEQPSYYDANPTSPYGSDVIAEMNQHYGYISWGGHGTPTSITVKTGGVNNINPKYAITSVQADSIPWITHESANGLDNLTNKDYPMFAYSIACTITPFDVLPRHAEFPNIGQSFTLGKNYGGPVLVGNTRNGRIRYSKEMQMKFNEYLISDPMVGPAQNYAKMNYHHHDLRHCSNIIGCPNIRVWTDIPTFFSATLSYNNNNCIITPNCSATDAEIGIRNITQLNDTVQSVNFNPSLGSTTLTNVENSLITLTGKNCLPHIFPLTIQNTTLQGSHYVIAKDVTCGTDVREGTQGDVVFDEGSDYIFETNGAFILSKGVTIKQGAQLQVIPSEINY